MNYNKISNSGNSLILKKNETRSRFHRLKNELLNKLLKALVLRKIITQQEKTILTTLPSIPQ